MPSRNHATLNVPARRAEMQPKTIRRDPKFKGPALEPMERKTDHALEKDWPEPVPLTSFSSVELPVATCRDLGEPGT
jgi:hypothetical protein